MVERLVVVGADAAGMSAAAQARRRAPVESLEIVAFDRGNWTSYSACGLPYLVGDLVHDAEDLVARSPDEHRERGIDVHLRHEVVGIDVAAASVRVRALDDGRESHWHYDQLLIATGAVPIRPPLPGIDAAGVFGIQTLDDGIELRRAVDERRPERVVVIGAGYIGIEMAEAMQNRGISVTVVERADNPMGTIDPDMGALVAAAMRETGIGLRLGDAVEGIESDERGRVTAVVTGSGSLPADLVVLGLGVRPNSTLASDAGIAVGATGGIATDARMATDHAGVWAAGDCAESLHRVTRRPVTIALGTHANKQGRVVGVNVTGGRLTFPGVIGTAVTRVCEIEIARTGLQESEAAAAGFDVVSARIDARTRAHYYPGAQPITVKVVAEAGSGRLLGAQIVGREGAAGRIDVLAAAVWNEMTVAEVSQLDLAYAPPFAPVWDPVLIAARQADARL